MRAPATAADVAAHRRFGVDRIDLQQELAGLTRSPSLTASCVTRPIVWALMLTVFFGSILPDAETIASRSRFWMVSTVTVRAGVATARERSAARAAGDHDSTITIQNHFLRNTSPPKSSEPLSQPAMTAADRHAPRGCHAHIDGHAAATRYRRAGLAGRGREPRRSAATSTTARTRRSCRTGAPATCLRRTPAGCPARLVGLVSDSDT